MLYCQVGNKPSLLICNQKGCDAHPVMCADQACRCKDSHKQHRINLVDGFMEILAKPIKLTSEQLHFEQALAQITQEMHQQIDQLHRRYLANVNSSVRHNYRYGLLRESLLASRPPSEAITGDIMARMLGQMQTHGSNSNVYDGLVGQLSVIYEGEVRDHLKGMVDKISSLWDFIDITIENPNKSTFQLTVSKSATVNFLKQRIQHTQGIPFNIQYLILEGKELKGTQPLSNYSIDKGAIIRLATEIARDDFQLFLRRPNNQILTVQASPFSTVHEVKLIVKEKYGIPVDEQRINYLGKQLDNDLSLSDYSIQREVTLTINVNVVDKQAREPVRGQAHSAEE